MTVVERRPSLLAELTREEIRARAPSCVVVVPFGATEQHGPHLPVGLDAFVAAELAGRAATRVPERVDVIVAPVLVIGCSEHHLAWAGTVSLRPATFLTVVVDVLRSLALSGFEKVFVLNAHGGNTDLARAAARTASLEHRVDVAVGDWWADLRRAETLGARVPGHAGAVETAVLVSLRPELVREHPTGWSRAEAPPSPFSGSYRLERAGAWAVIDGVSDDPSRAEAIDGSALVEEATASLATAITAFADAPRILGLEGGTTA